MKYFPMVDASLDRVMARMATLCHAVPPAIELGVHLCYGDFGAKHLMEPRDASRMVEIMNAMTGAVSRTITYFHIPVPITRDDDAYFAPLSELRLAPQTELYVGLVHASDGVEGARRRMATADRHIARPYGIATECGMARQRTPALVRKLLELHAEIARD